jgi:hypothetical protein
VIGANIYIVKYFLIKERERYDIDFKKSEYLAIMIIKCLVLPFLGVIFAYISFSIIPDNRALIFTAFIQWLLPTSIDIMAIVQSKEVNGKNTAIVIVAQWIWFVLLNNFIVIPAFLKTVNLL